MLTAENITKYLITRSTLDDKPVCNIQLQCMLYLIQGYFKSRLGYFAFEDKFTIRRGLIVIEEVHDRYKYSISGISPVIGIFPSYEDINYLTSDMDEQLIINNILVNIREANKFRVSDLMYGYRGVMTESMDGFFANALLLKYFNNNSLVSDLAITFDSMPVFTLTEDAKRCLEYARKLHNLGI